MIGEIFISSDAKALITEKEPFPRYPVLVPGGGGTTGEFFTRKLAKEGFTVYAGTRDRNKFDALRESIVRDGGVAPLPFTADVTDSDQLLHSYEEMGLKEGAPVHYFPLAAAGYENLRRPIMRPLVTLSRAFREGAITKELAITLTEQIKAGVQDAKALALANATNKDGLLTFAGLLQQHGHLREESVIGTLSSTISDYTDPDNPEDYPGPWVYFPIGISKAQGVKGLKKIAQETKARYIDFVAPEIEGTGVGDFFADLDPIIKVLNSLDSQKMFVPPKVTKTEVTDSMYHEISRTGPSLQRIRKVYIQPGGVISYQRPQGWDKPWISYL